MENDDTGIGLSKRMRKRYGNASNKGLAVREEELVSHIGRLSIHLDAVRTLQKERAARRTHRAALGVPPQREELYRFKLLDVRDFLPGGQEHDHNPLSADEAIEILDDVVSAFGAPVPILFDPAAIHAGPERVRQAALGWVRKLERLGPELWGEGDFVGDGRIPQGMHALAPLTEEQDDGWRLACVFPAGGDRDARFYPTTWEGIAPWVGP